MQEVMLTPQQAKLWTETKSRLLLEAPAFAHVLFNMCSHGRAQTALFTHSCPIAATNGKDLLLNPDTFFDQTQFSNADRTFIVAHEILHKIFDHMGTMQRWRRAGVITFADGERLPYKHDIMNQAMDYVINDILVEAGIGRMPSVGLHDRNIGTANDKVHDVYRKIWQDTDGDGGGEGSGFDEHLEPGPGDVRNEHEWKAAVAAGMAAAKAQGKMPGSLARLFEEMLDPQIDWREHIAMLLARRTGTGGVDWRKPHRRHMEAGFFAPSSKGFGCGTLVVMGDLSGSISNKEVAMFFAELGGILEDLNPERVVVLWFDHGVRRVDTIEEGGDLAEIRSKPVDAGGGTCFHAPFAKVSELGLQPDAAVVLTDGYASFPSHAPNYPVIWGSIERPPEDYPWGDVVCIPKVGAQ